jgi:hypothetical protein
MQEQEHDFSGVGDTEEYTSVPAGNYRCKIGEVRVGFTKEGSVRWALRLEVAGGEYAGRTAAWDGLVWNDRGLPRIKYFLRLLGYDTGGRVRLEPHDLVGREVLASLQEEEREDPLSGRRVLRLRVPYLGYGQAGNGAPAPF